MHTDHNTVRSEQEWLEQIRTSALQSNFTTAESLLSNALEEHSHSFELRRALAGIYRQQQLNAKAESLLRTLMAERPDDVASAFLLAHILKDQAHTSAAAQVMRSLFQHGCHDTEIAIKAIELLDDCCCKQDAATIAENAILTSPGDPRLHAYAGMLEIQLGEFERARKHYLFALKHGPQACEWHVPHGIAAAQRYQDKEHPDFAMFRECLEQDELSDKARASLLFALGKAHDDVGDYVHAAQFFRGANSLAHALTKWSRKQWRRAIEARLAAKALVHRLDPPSDWTPVFIVGMPRSGTTLVAELLSHYADVCNHGELPWIPTLAQDLMFPGDPARSALERAAAVYATHLRTDHFNARWHIDKHPLNFRYVDLILALWPNAKIIHCQRSSRDTALSLWTQSFTDDLQGYAYDFTDIAAVMRDCERLMTHWHKAHAGSIRAIRYEQVVANPQRSIAALGAWIGLPDIEATPARSDKPSSSISTASLWQARQPVYTRSAGRWRNYAPHLPELMRFSEN